jgi:hypothetical protein
VEVSTPGACLDRQPDQCHEQVDVTVAVQAHPDPGAVGVRVDLAVAGKDVKQPLDDRLGQPEPGLVWLVQVNDVCGIGAGLLIATR